MNCLELWVKFLCADANNIDFQPPSYLMAHIVIEVAHLVPTARYIVIGVAHLVPTACYTPLTLRCTKMLNTLASTRGIFIHVASLLFDMLECKELDRTSTVGYGKAFDYSIALKVPNFFLKTRAFQD